MNNDNLGLALLGILSLFATIGTGIYFSPLIHDLKPAYIAELKNTIIGHAQTTNPTISSTSTTNPQSPKTNTKQPTLSTKTPYKTPTPAMICMSLTQQTPHEFWLHDKYAKVTTDANGITKTSFKTLTQQQIIVFDDNGTQINEQFMARLLALHKQHEPLMLNGDIMNYRKKACIDINYLIFNDDYYVYPIN